MFEGSSKKTFYKRRKEKGFALEDASADVAMQFEDKELVIAKTGQPPASQPASETEDTGFEKTVRNLCDMRTSVMQPRPLVMADEIYEVVPVSFGV